MGSWRDVYFSGPEFESLPLSLAGFVLGKPEFKSSATIVKQPTGLPPIRPVGVLILVMYLLNYLSYYPCQTTQGERIIKYLYSPSLTYLYSGTPPYDHPVDKTTPLLRPLFCGPNKSPLIFLSENPVNPTTPLLRPTTTFGSPESLFSL